MITINLNDDQIDICRRFAEDCVQSYVDGKKEQSRLMAIPEKQEIYTNVKVQMVGRMAEYAFCETQELCALNALNWSDMCDDGADVTLLNGQTVDVKASDHPNAKRLIWPVSKIHFLNKCADYLVFARVDVLKQSVTFFGFAERDYFITCARYAKNERGIVDDTPYMLIKDLRPMEKLPYLRF